MRIIQSGTPRPLNLLAVGPGGLVVAASRSFVAQPEIEAWAAATGEHLWTSKYPDIVTAGLIFVLGGRMLLVATVNGTSLLKLAPGGPKPAGETNTGWQSAIIATGDRAFVGRRDAGVVKLVCLGLPGFDTIWTQGRWDSVTRFGCGEIDTAGVNFAVSVVVEDTHPRLYVSVRATETGAERARIALDAASPARQLAFTADGSKLLVRTDDRKVQLFAAASGAAAGELVHPGRAFVTGIAVHPRGPVACARTNGTVTLWNPDTREQLRTLDWKAGRLVSVAFSTDGALAAAGTEDGKVVVWDVDV